ncbi:MAG: helix-turn-helix transcriptional regulator [Selenomonadales bacterium]|nr:helix-turn-helix transcriptional regulator [Selenomonadales bacterium]
MQTKETDIEKAAEERIREKYRIVGRKIAYYRRLKEYTQAQLAGEIGVSANYLSQIECGKRNKYSLHTLMLVSEVLGVPLKKFCE